MKQSDLSILTEGQRNKLTRDYEKFPLKRGEEIPREDLYYIYMDLNLDQCELSKIFGRNDGIIRSHLKKFNIIKSKEALIEKHRQTCMKKYGGPAPMSSPMIKDKAKATNHSKYGADYPIQNSKVKEKQKQTNLERYGTEYYFNTSDFKEKQKQTNLERYGTEQVLQSPEIRQKIQATCLDRYGKPTYMGTKEFMQQVAETSLERYGTIDPTHTEEANKKRITTLFERYGVDNIFKSSEFKVDRNKKMLERYGNECFNRSEYYQKDQVMGKRLKTNLERFGVVHPMMLDEFKEKRDNTCLERHGVTNPMKKDWVIQKRDKTININGTYTKSKPEDEIFALLQQKFIEVERNFRSIKYPFKCDFYIPSLDLYIEYQGYQGHGGEPFDPNNIKHQEIVESWDRKGKEINFRGKPKKQYHGYIKTWTISDPLKRETAKKNNLNWIEFFTMQEFENWYAELGEKYA